MAKRKINAAMILAAGEDAHLQVTEKVSHANIIENETFLEINIKDIKNNPMQPRMHINEEELENLMHSIKLNGLIQPIAVIKVGKKDYVLKAGQRRLLAHKKLGYKKIKAIVQSETLLQKKESNKSLFEISVMENTHRDNLNPLELALSIRRALDQGLYKNMEDISKALGKSSSYISKINKVLNLDETIIQDLTQNQSTKDIEALYEIQKIKNKKEQIRIYFDFISNKIDRKDLRILNKRNHISDKNKKPYNIDMNSKKVKFEFNTSKLTKNEIKEINDKIESILNKYLNK